MTNIKRPINGSLAWNKKEPCYVSNLLSLLEPRPCSKMTLLLPTSTLRMHSSSLHPVVKTFTCGRVKDQAKRKAIWASTFSKNSENTAEVYKPLTKVKQMKISGLPLVVNKTTSHHQHSVCQLISNLVSSTCQTLEDSCLWKKFSDLSKRTSTTPMFKFLMLTAPCTSGSATNQTSTSRLKPTTELKNTSQAFRMDVTPIMSHSVKSRLDTSPQVSKFNSWSGKTMSPPSGWPPTPKPCWWPKKLKSMQKSRRPKPRLLTKRTILSKASLTPPPTCLHTMIWKVSSPRVWRATWRSTTCQTKTSRKS